MFLSHETISWGRLLSLKGTNTFPNQMKMQTYPNIRYPIYFTTTEGSPKFTRKKGNKIQLKVLSNKIQLKEKN